MSVTVASDSPAGTTLEYQLNRYHLIPTVVGGVHHVKVRMDREPITKVVGAPELPVVHRSVIIGPDAEVAPRIIAATYTDIPDVDVVPSRGFLFRTVHDPATEPYVFGSQYAVDDFFPSNLVELGTPYVFRDYRGIVVKLQPFQYNPVKRVLRIYESVTVEIARIGVSSTNVLTTSPLGYSLAFHQLSEGHFLNHGTRSAYAPLNEDGDLLIIAHDEWVSNMQPLIDHKESIGIDTTIVPISDVGNSSSSIKSYIESAYGSGNLAFVLLVGDKSQVATPYASGGAADPTYAKVSGNDSYPDILVGRFSATNSSHVDTQVERTIDYELSRATQQPWFKKAVGIASFEGPGDDGEYDNEHIDNIRDDLLGAGWTEVDQFYGGSATSSQLIDALNEGRGLVNYAGHGSPQVFATTNFSNSKVDNLTNTGKLPFVVSVACNTGEFDTGTCLSEAMMRSTSSGAPTGAIAAYASSISQSWNPPMAAQDEMADLFVAETYWSLGALAFAGSAKMIDEYGGGGASMFNTWILFGDPSLRVVGTVEPDSGIRVTPDEDFVVEADVGGPFANTQRDYTVENHGDYAVDLLVVSSKPWVDVNPSAGAIPAGGSVVVTVQLNNLAEALPSGYWEDGIQFINDTDHQGDTVRTVALITGEPEKVFDWPLDEDPGWTLQGDWDFGRPAGNGGDKMGSPDPTSGHTGDNVYGYNLDGEYPNDLAAKHLTTSTIDCSELKRVRLRFWRWLNVEESQYDQASVSVSADGENWTKVWANPSSNLTDDAWQEVELDISEVADGQPSVQIRWTMGDTDGGLTGSGWNIDDIEIWAYESSCDDLDGDGVLPPECGGDDCNDFDDSVLPGAGEICDDMVDNDCDGDTDAIDTDCGGPGGGNNPPGSGNDVGGLHGVVFCAMGAPASSLRGGLWLLLMALALGARRRGPRGACDEPSDKPRY